MEAFHKHFVEGTNIKIKSECMCVIEYEVDILDFLVGMVISPYL